MANVISGSDITVIVLEPKEASALADLLYANSDLTFCADWPVLDELTNAMISPACTVCDAQSMRDDSDDASHVAWQAGKAQFKAVEEGAGINLVMHPVCQICNQYVFAVDGCKGHA